MMVASKTFRRFAIAAVLASSLGFYGAETVSGGPLLAQVRGPIQRVVTGTVQNKDGQGIKGAVVYLKDTRSSSVKSAISEDNGSYRFVQLSQNTDYELYAKSGDKTSKSRSISSFDTKNEFTINLKID